MQSEKFGAVVIGGGFYGCEVARELKQYFENVLLLESESDLMQRASYRNQARVHQGYHYPRSLLTSLRSRVNFSRFINEYKGCVYSEFEKVYAIARSFSKTSAAQFKGFCDRIGAPIGPAADELRALLNPHHVEDVFSVLEYVFDSAKLKDIVKVRLAEAAVEYELNAMVERLRYVGDQCRVEFRHRGEIREVEARYVFICAYSHINGVLWRSDLPLIPMKHEFAEMALIDVPEELKNKGITIMDGPFFAVMPFPDRGLHTLHHVRYTPHHWWMDTPGEGYLDAHKHFENAPRETQYEHMIRDATRFIPSISRSKYVESLWEVKTILPRSEVDDSRPILFRPVDKVPNVICVLGGKIDNVFDVIDYIREFVESNGVKI